MVAKIARDAVKASLDYPTLPQASSCSLMVTAVFAAFTEVYYCFRQCFLAALILALLQEAHLLLLLTTATDNADVWIAMCRMFAIRSLQEM